MQKGQTLIYLLIGILVLAVAGGVYFFINSNGKMCGGFAGEQGKLACPVGYKCQYPSPHYPDAQGQCVNILSTFKFQ